MATRTWIGTTSASWNVNTNWLEGAFATSVDDVVFGALQVNPITTNVASAAKSIDFTNYGGTLTMTNNLTVSGNITLVTGMTITGSAILIINATSTMTSNGKAWGLPLQLNLNTYTLADNFTCSNFTTAGSPTVNGNKLNITGSFTTGSNFAGTTEVVMIGTGTLNVSGQLRSNLTINTTGTTTIAACTFNGMTLNYSAGTTISTGTVSTVTNPCTFNTNGDTSPTATTTSTTGINFSGLTLIATTNNSNLRCIGTLTIAGTISGSNIYAKDSVVINGGATAVSLTMDGTGSLTAGANIQNTPIIFNTTGTTTVGSLTINNASFTYTSGNIITTGSTITCVTNGSTFNTAGMNWNIITYSTSLTTTINSTLTLNDNLNLGGLSQTFAGTAGWTIPSLSGFTTAAKILTLQASNTYNVTSPLTIAGTSASHNSIVSSSATVRAFFNLAYGVAQDISFCDGTRIDSSGGQTIWSYKASLTDTINWNVGVKPPIIAYVF